MKDFLKIMLATVCGIIVTGVIFSIFGILMLVGVMAAGTEGETVVKENSVMVLKLNGILDERSQENPLELLGGSELATYGLDDILASIKKAKENDDIKGIYIEGNALAGGFSSLQEIRNALIDFKESGKFIIAYADSYTRGVYYLGSVADKVMLNPKGMVEWTGLAAQPIFYKDMLAKVGVEMQIFKVGTYKSAVEPYINKEMSPANREQVSAFLGSIWGNIIGEVSASRGISADSLNALADRGLMFAQAEELVKCGLVDTLIYKNDVRKYLKQRMDIDEDDDLNTLGLKAMTNVKKNVPKDKSGNIIAVYYATGAIDDASNPDPNSGINSAKVIKDLRRLADDDDVKAVVLRVNSPGGSAYGSEQIWYAVEQLKKEKPVIVSMGDYAASGGYYIACGADTIVAEPTTLTGSIGIFGMFPNAQELTRKVGLDFDVVKTNQYADFGSMYRPMNESEKSLLQQYIDQGYDLFLTRCSEGRGIDKASLDKIAQGRVWTGEMAKDLGLVDVLGGIDTALDLAISKAGVEAYTVSTYPKKLSFFETLLNTDAPGYLKAHLLDGNVGEWYRQFSLLNNLEQQDRIQARLPFELNIQ